MFSRTSAVPPYVMPRRLSFPVSIWFRCQKPDCALYGRRGADNLSVCDRYGKYGHIRLLSCNACKPRFSER